MKEFSIYEFTQVNVILNVLVVKEMKGPQEEATRCLQCGCEYFANTGNVDMYSSLSSDALGDFAVPLLMALSPTFAFAASERRFLTKNTRSERGRCRTDESINTMRFGGLIWEIDAAREPMHHVAERKWI